MVRRAAVAGRWYPGTRDALEREVDRYLASARASSSTSSRLVAVIAPHAGLMYSGPIAAYAYDQIQAAKPDVAILVGPSHFVAFDGVAIDLSEGFETPLGLAETDRECADAVIATSAVVREFPAAHEREHSLEMQMPFLKRVAPAAKIVALVMGRQTADTARELGDAIATAAKGRRAVLIASSDLSHYHDAATAGRMDRVVVDRVAENDAAGLQSALDREPDHACGGGPMVAVMHAAKALGADRARVLKYGDSGDVSGDKTAVVGYMAAAIGHDERS
jgi:AmmeMemoRadiSam system protein B